MKKRTLSKQGDIRLPDNIDLKISYKSRKMIPRTLFPNDVAHIWITDAPDKDGQTIIKPAGQRNVDYMLRVTKNGTIIVEDLTQMTPDDF